MGMTPEVLESSDISMADIHGGVKKVMGEFGVSAEVATGMLIIYRLDMLASGFAQIGKGGIASLLGGFFNGGAR